MEWMDDVLILKIYFGEYARWEGKPVYDVVLKEALKQGLAGASVFRGIIGFGASSLIHTVKLVDLAENLPLTIEIVDKRERIEAFLPTVQEIVPEGVITLQPVQAIFHLPTRVRDIMAVNVPVVAPDTPLDQVFTLFMDHGLKAVPVLEGRKVVGVVTGGDMLGRGGLALRLSLHQELPEALRAEQKERLALDGKTAREVMTAPVVTINLKATVQQAAGLMAEHSIKRVPVLDGADRFVGVVSRADVLRTYSKAATVQDRLPALPTGLTRKAVDVMFTDVPTATMDAPLPSVLEQLMATPLRRVVVLDRDGRVVGIVLDRSLIARFSRSPGKGLLHRLVGFLTGTHVGDPLEGAARDVMEHDVYAVDSEAEVGAILNMMLARKAKRLVVVDQGGRLKGMVDRDSLMRVLSEA